MCVCVTYILAQNPQKYKVFGLNFEEKSTNFRASYFMEDSRKMEPARSVIIKRRGPITYDFIR
jgi:hypothetical protein